MSDLKICRICLRTECKVYKYDRYQLKSYYEEVLALKVNENEPLPRYFCYECATMLHKFHKFKEKCYVGQQTLREISWRGPMTYEAVYKVDRKAKNLISSIEILTATRKRVKTYNKAADSDDSDNSDDSDDDSEPESDTETLTKIVNYTEPPIDIVNKTETTTEMDYQTDTLIEKLSDTDAPVETVDTYLSDDSVKHDDFLDPEMDPVDETKIKDVSSENKPAIVVDDIKTDLETLPHEPKSPETVFVSDNVTSTLSKDSMNRKRRKNLQKQKVVQREPKFAKKGKINKKWANLTPGNWKQSSLSEEEALERFRKRADDPKYTKAPFKCSECFKGFSKEEMMKRHHVLRHAESNGAVECRFCKMRFKWDCMLRKHMRAHYAQFECLRCGLVCSREQSAVLHDGYHSGVKKKCVHCGDEFKHLSTYYTHLRTHRSTHLCTVCGASFVSQMGLRMHRKIKHVDGEIDSPDEDAPVNTFCDKCDVNFETRKAYEEHMFHSALHTDIFVNQVEEPNVESAPKKVLGKKLQGKITDELKGKITKIDGFDVAPERKRMRHRRVMKRFRRKPTTCYQCGKHFETQSACMKHHLAEHPRTSFCPPSERYICEFCGVSLAPGSVATHQNIHRKEKTHSCETCGRDFHSTVGLKRHMVTHTGEKPYPCMLCEKRFTQSNSMKLHYKTFHLKQPYPKRNRRKKDEGRRKRRSTSTSDSSSSQSATEAAAPAQYMPPSNGNLSVLYPVALPPN